jgi:type VI secretion system secreted protein Hcp
MTTFEASRPNTPRMIPQFGCETHQGSALKTFRWLALTLSVIFCLASPIAAQNGNGQGAAQGTTLNATVAGLGCGTNQFSVLSFSWGASNPVTVGAGGLGTGKVSISSFNITKAFDACSPALFSGAVKGTHFSSLTMVQLDQKNIVLMTVTLSNVIVESIQWSGSAGGGQTTESVSFAFAKTCIQDGPSGNKLCYDATTNTIF